MDVRVTDAVVPQLSVTVGGVQLTVLLQLGPSFETVMLDGHPLNTGLIVSITVTVNVQSEEFPEVSEKV